MVAPLPDGRQPITDAAPNMLIERGHDPLAVRASAGRWLLCVQLFWHWRWNALHALIHRLPLCNCLHQLAVMMAHSFMLEKAAGAGWVSAWTLKTLIASSAMLRH